MAFRVLDKDGTGTIQSKAFKHLMTHIGKLFFLIQDFKTGVCTGFEVCAYTPQYFAKWLLQPFGKINLKL